MKLVQYTLNIFVQFSQYIFNHFGFSPIREIAKKIQLSFYRDILKPIHELKSKVWNIYYLDIFRRCIFLYERF